MNKDWMATAVVALIVAMIWAAVIQEWIAKN